MTRSFWKRKIRHWLEPDPTLHPMGEDVYSPQKKLKIAFWFEGGLKVTGDNSDLSVNFNDPDLLILSLLVRKTIRIYRVPYSRLVCFELIRGGAKDEDVFTNRFSVN